MAQVPPSNFAGRLNIAFGPGDCVCANFADPRSLSGSNLPHALSQLLANWLTEKPDPYSDLDSGADSVADTDTDPGHDSDAESKSRSRRRSDDENRDCGVPLERSSVAN
jgi:hypothetical protein